VINSSSTDLSERLKSAITAFPDFPSDGILFRDISPVFADAVLLADCIQELSARFEPVEEIDVVVGVEARGFPLATLMANKLGKPMVMARKPSKLPGERVKVEYELEYGTDSIEIQRKAISEGQNVFIVDDLLATGGTALATAQAILELKANISGCGFIVELSELGGRDVLSSYRLETLVNY